MTLEMLYGFPVLSKDCEETKGRWALYQTLLYCEKILRKRKQGRERRPHVKNDGDEPVEKDDCEANVGYDPPRHDKRRWIVGDLAPVEGEDTHGHTMCNPKELVTLTLLGAIQQTQEKLERAVKR
jgi:hypothetical protein